MSNIATLSLGFGQGKNLGIKSIGKIFHGLSTGYRKPSDMIHSWIDMNGKRINNYYMIDSRHSGKAIEIYSGISSEERNNIVNNINSFIEEYEASLGLPITVSLPVKEAIIMLCEKHNNEEWSIVRKTEKYMGHYMDEYYLTNGVREYKIDYDDGTQYKIRHGKVRSNKREKRIS